MAELQDFLVDVLPRLGGADLTLQSRIQCNFAAFTFGAAVAAYLNANEAQGLYLSPVDIAKTLASTFVGDIQRQYIQG